MNMFRWAHPEHLYALIALPVLAAMILLSWRQRNKKLGQYGDHSLVEQLTAKRSSRKPKIGAVLILFSYTMLVVAWADPQIGSRLEEVKRQGVDVVIALDVSNSMKAEDLRPNRLERAKQVISRLIDRLENDRIGIVVFAGKAYVQLPITTDYAAAKLFLSTIEPNMVPTQGTAIGTAIRLASTSFNKTDKKHKVIVVITDGENHEDDALEATKEAIETGAIIHTIGMGSPDGTPIPLNGSGFLKDKEGQTVLTKLDEVTLQKIAAESKGIYIRSTQADDGLDELLKQIGRMEKKTFGTKQYTDYEDRFQFFLAAALLALLLESVLGERKSAWIRRLKLFGENEN
ncbi:MAG: VWA domain-containing protein [Bacteroidota bacterium]